MLVKDMLGPPVQVQRFKRVQLGGVIRKQFRSVCRAIGGSGGGIDEAGVIARTPVPEAAGKGDVGAPHQIRIPRGGFTDRSHMEDRVHFGVGLQKSVKFFRRDESGRSMPRQIPPFQVGPQPIHHKSIQPAFGKGSLKTGANETGATGNDNHGSRV
ncbi:hypothetical protein ATR1_075c0045 [Acetobacter tropicalis]|nr:hypothetical protein ATR1_075c0045 [Acetobacter tropicalis]